MKYFNIFIQIILIVLLLNQSHLLLRDCVLRTNFEIRLKETLTWYMQHQKIGPIINPLLDEQIRGKRNPNMPGNQDLPLLFLGNAPVFVTIHAQLYALTAGFVLLNTRSACLLAIINSVLSLIFYNLYEILVISGLCLDGRFGEKFWEWQG